MPRPERGEGRIAFCCGYASTSVQGRVWVSRPFVALARRLCGIHIECTPGLVRREADWLVGVGRRPFVNGCTLIGESEMPERTTLLLMGIYSTVGLFTLGSVAGASEGLQSWELWGQLPENVTGDSPAATDTHWYMFEESCFSAASCVGTFYAEVSSDGSVGPWLPSTDRTLSRLLFSTVVTDSHMYLVGGQVANPLGNTGLVEYASVNPDGSLGPWATTSPLNNPRESFGLVLSGDHLYALGGTIASAGFGVGRNTEYARINPDGSLGAWQAGPQLNERHPGCAAAAIDGHVYVFGGGVHGYRTKTVERAVINPDGSLGPWELDTPLPEYRSEMGIAVFANRIYLAGGHTSTFGRDHLTSVMYSTVLLDHTLGPWTETESLMQGTLIDL